MTLAQIGQFGSVVDRLAAAQGRLVATAVIVAVAGGVATLLLPALVRALRRAVARRYLDGHLADRAARIDELFPLTTPVRLALGAFQAAVVLVAILSLLQVWDQFDTAVAALSALEVAPAEVGRAFVTAVLLLGAYVGMGLVSDAIESFGREANRMTAHQEQIVTRVLQLSLLGFVGLVVLAVWDLDPGGLFVGAGFLGIVLGLAARQTLGSLIAGFVLMFSRPFEIGDWIVVGDQEGVVTDITIVNTRLENFDGEFVVIPNDRVADRAITNRSQKGRLRLRIDVGIDYDADPDRAAGVAETAVETVDLVEGTPAPHAFPREFGDSAILLELRFWIETPTPPKRWRAQAAVVRAVDEAFEREGIEIPYPQRELSGRHGDGGFRVGGPGETKDGDVRHDPGPDGSQS